MQSEFYCISYLIGFLFWVDANLLSGLTLPPLNRPSSYTIAVHWLITVNKSAHPNGDTLVLRAGRKCENPLHRWTHVLVLRGTSPVIKMSLISSQTWSLNSFRMCFNNHQHVSCKLLTWKTLISSLSFWVISPQRACTHTHTHTIIISIKEWHCSKSPLVSSLKVNWWQILKLEKRRSKSGK